jgi:predicted secreted Zn-dependent protease
MLKTAVGFDADRVISAIVDRHDSGDQLYDRVISYNKNYNHFLYFFYYFNTKEFMY